MVVAAYLALAQQGNEELLWTVNKESLQYSLPAFFIIEYLLSLIYYLLTLIS